MKYEFTDIFKFYDGKTVVDEDILMHSIKLFYSNPENLNTLCFNIDSTGYEPSPMKQKEISAKMTVAGKDVTINLPSMINVDPYLYTETLIKMEYYERMFGEICG